MKPMILIAGYPKCGNTWIGYLLSYYFNAPYLDVYVEEDVLTGTLSVDDISYTYNHGGFQGEHIRPNESEVRAIVKTHAQPQDVVSSCPNFWSTYRFDSETDRELLITRNPKDVAVSYYFFEYFRIAKARNHWSTIVPYSIRAAIYKPLFFSRFVLNVARAWSEFTTQWLAREPLIVWYEDLLVDPLTELRRVTTGLNLAFHPQYAKEAEDHCAFASMRAREEQYGGPGRNNERFYRQGTSGIGRITLQHGWRVSSMTLPPRQSQHSNL